jgi:sporulation protein YlmC with PRC-barrel domain
MNHENPSVLSTSTLSGTSVENPQGENLGHIEDIMIDLSTGRVSYAVLSFGGILGLGDKLFAVPWDAFAINTDEEEFVLDVNREFLENAPGFDKNDWPSNPDMTWYNEVYSYYDVEPYWQATP